ncbi:hypothetical protein [Halosimplex amylolyticum]|uniref:hypothetical protein n=1 Tax=Halosimplex amylolyticum TaxID=3396616 RepID=UPI003F55B75D
MADDSDDPTVPVICAECETETEIALDDVAEAVDRHNDRLHDGDAVAQVDPALADQVRDLVAEDLGLFDDTAQD